MFPLLQVSEYTLCGTLHSEGQGRALISMVLGPWLFWFGVVRISLSYQPKQQKYVRVSWPTLTFLLLCHPMHLLNSHYHYSTTTSTTSHDLTYIRVSLGAGADRQAVGCQACTVVVVGARQGLGMVWACVVASRPV